MRVDRLNIPDNTQVEEACSGDVSLGMLLKSIAIRLERSVQDAERTLRASFDKLGQLVRADEEIVTILSLH